MRYFAMLSSGACTPACLGSATLTSALKAAVASFFMGAIFRPLIQSSCCTGSALAAKRAAPLLGLLRESACVATTGCKSVRNEAGIAVDTVRVKAGELAEMLPPCGITTLTSGDLVEGEATAKSCRPEGTTGEAGSRLIKTTAKHAAAATTPPNA